MDLDWTKPIAIDTEDIKPIQKELLIDIKPFLASSIQFAFVGEVATICVRFLVCGVGGGSGVMVGGGGRCSRVVVVCGHGRRLVGGQRGRHPVVRVSLVAGGRRRREHPPERVHGDESLFAAPVFLGPGK